MPDPTVPHGHVVMEKKEKEETLNVLVRSKESYFLHLSYLNLIAGFKKFKKLLKITMFQVVLNY